MDQPKRNPIQIVAVLGLAGLGYLFYTGQLPHPAPAPPVTRHLQPGMELLSIPSKNREQLLREFRTIDQTLSEGILTLQKQADQARYDAAIRLGGVEFLTRGNP